MSDKTQYDLCIFHGGCDDGFGAAWAYWNSGISDSTVYYPAAYQRDPPDCAGKTVLIVDFSYKRPVMEKILDVAKTVTVLDHHKTAQTDLASLFAGGKLLGEFDMDRSGAMMTWDWFNPGVKPPDLLSYIQDRDLWRKELPRCDEVIMALRSYPQDFETWGKLMWDRSIEALSDEGEAIHRYYRTLVDEAKQRAYTQTIGGHKVPVVNVPHYLASEVAGELSEGHLFAATYWDKTDGYRTYSLRTRGSFDVGAFAQDHFGGGGHPGAAAFEIQIGHAPVRG